MTIMHYALFANKVEMQLCMYVFVAIVHFPGFVARIDLSPLMRLACFNNRLEYG